MNLSNWITINYDMLLTTAKNIVKDDAEVDDVFQSVIEQLLKKEDTLNELPDNDKKYYFIRVLKNNWNSTTSYYYTEHKKVNRFRVDWDEKYENIEDTPYKEELPTLDWVKGQLDTLDWFSRDLFWLWIELGTFISVSNKTTIPVNSVARYIKQIKLILKDKWENRS